MVAIDNKFEGAYVVRRGGCWYLFGSAGQLLRRPDHRLQRAGRPLRGPARPLRRPRRRAAAGRPRRRHPDADRRTATGGSAPATTRWSPTWPGRTGSSTTPSTATTRGWTSPLRRSTERPMLIDRLDWVDGWPYVRADAGPSDDTAARAGHRRPGVHDLRGRHPAAVPHRGRLVDATADPQSGATPTPCATGRRSPRRWRTRAQVRAEADIRGAAGIVLGPATRSGAADPGVGRPRREPAARAGPRRRGPGDRAASAALPANYDPDVWHSLSVEVRGDQLHAELTARPARRPARGRRHGPARRCRLRRRGRRHRPREGRRRRQPERPHGVHAGHRARPGARARNPGPRRERRVQRLPQPGWTFVDDTRGNPDPRCTGAELVWPVENTDLNGRGNDAGLLLRDPPSQHGNWAIETKLTLDTGVNEVLNYQQGGIVAYVDDDLFTRLSNVAIWNTRQTEFGKEMTDVNGRPAQRRHHRRTARRHDVPADRAPHRPGQRRARAAGLDEARGRRLGEGRGLDPSRRRQDHPHRPDLARRQGGDPRTSRFDYFRTYTG